MDNQINIQKENIINAYKNGNQDQKALLENLFGKDIFQSKDIKERVKTFEDACRELGNEHPFVKSYEKYVNTARLHNRGTNIRIKTGNASMRRPDNAFSQSEK